MNSKLLKFKAENALDVPQSEELFKCPTIRCDRIRATYAIGCRREYRCQVNRRYEIPIKWSFFGCVYQWKIEFNRDAKIRDSYIKWS